MLKYIYGVECKIAKGTIDGLLFVLVCGFAGLLFLLFYDTEVWRGGGNRIAFREIFEFLFFSFPFLLYFSPFLFCQ